MGPAGGPPGRGGEKAKDLIGTWKKLLGYCRRYKVVFVIALICAAAGTVLTLAGPDQLSRMTDVVTEGIAPDTEKLGEIIKSAATSQGADVVVDGVTISVQDQLAMMDVLSEQDGEDAQAALGVLEELPDSVYNLIKPSIDMGKVAEIGFLLIALYALSYLLSAVQGCIMATVTQRVSQKMRSDISGKINRLPMWFYNRTTTGDVLSRVTNDVDTIGQSLNQSIGNLISAAVLWY